MHHPTPAQARFESQGLGLFLSFGINSGTDLEWSFGELDPQGFNPERLDTDQWCRVAQSCGARFILLTCKHLDGFALWPTRYGSYGVRQSRFRGDVVGNLADSCRRHGLGLGVYYCLWDATNDRNDDASYRAFTQGQLSELMTGYGDVVEVWFDGAWTKIPWPADSRARDLTEGEWKSYDAQRFQQEWDRNGAPRWGWDDLYRLVKRHQPDSLVLNNGTTWFPGVPLGPVDARCGEKATGLSTNQRVWDISGQPTYLPLQIETTLSLQGPPGPFANGSWFWHPWDTSCADLNQVRGWIHHARDLGAVLLLNCGVMADGRIRPQDEDLLARIGSER